MYIRFSLTSLAAAAVLMSAPVAAQTAQMPPANQADQTKHAKDLNEIVCERQQDPGSRLAAAKVCHTRAEWADLRHQDREMVDQAQTRLGMPGK
jgi:hypothetical protein